MRVHHLTLHLLQRNYRKNLVEYLKQTACDKKLTQISLQLAVYLLDVFMDNHYITPEKLSLACNTCLLLAGNNVTSLLGFSLILCCNLSETRGNLGERTENTRPRGRSPAESHRERGKNYGNTRTEVLQVDCYVSCPGTLHTLLHASRSQF